MLTSQKHIRNSPALRAGLLILLLMIPSLAFGQTGGEIEAKVTGLGSYIYNTLRWPVCFLGLMIAVGMAKFHDNGVGRAVSILFATIAWALVPATIQVLKGLLG